MRWPTDATRMRMRMLYTLPQILQSMARTHRAAVAAATSGDVAALAQLLHGATPDAPRFATIKLLTALAKHKARHQCMQTVLPTSSNLVACGPPVRAPLNTPHAQDPVISQALVSSGLVVALVQELQTQQALVIAAATAKQADSPEAPTTPSSPTRGAFVSFTACSDSPASKKTEASPSTDRQQDRCVKRHVSCDIACLS